MRKLVSIVLVLAAASLAACGGGDVGLITVSWPLRTVSGTMIPTCPPDSLDARVVATSVTTGQEFIDLYDCDSVNFSGTSDYPADDYDVFVSIENPMLYGQSLTAAVDITLQDASVTLPLLDDGGYFQFDWTLRGAATSAALSCAQAGSTTVEIASSLGGSTKTEVFDCLDLATITSGLLHGDYLVTVSAFGAGDVLLGQAPPRNASIGIHNALSDLSLIEIPIDGM